MPDPDKKEVVEKVELIEVVAGADRPVGAVIIEIVELEEHAKHHHDKPAPHAKHYAFRVDKQHVVVEKPLIDGEHILAEVGKTPEKFKLYQHKRGHQPIQIGPKEEVDLRAPGLERFTTMPKDTTEGLIDGEVKRHFRLPETDEEYLKGLGLRWETVLDGNMRWLLIHGWRAPTGYNHAIVTLALLIPENYSDAQIDMVYFKEHLARADGRPIAQLTNQQICGTAWQRWSRHRTTANPWRAGIDDIASHLGLVDEWLSREFIK
jgi:hypothetical protein